jgi:hypothetical protein
MLVLIGREVQVASLRARVDGPIEDKLITGSGIPRTFPGNLTRVNSDGEFTVNVLRFADHDLQIPLLNDTEIQKYMNFGERLAHKLLQHSQMTPVPLSLFVYDYLLQELAHRDSDLASRDNLFQADQVEDWEVKPKFTVEACERLRPVITEDSWFYALNVSSGKRLIEYGGWAWGELQAPIWRELELEDDDDFEEFSELACCRLWSDYLEPPLKAISTGFQKHVHNISTVIQHRGGNGLSAATLQRMIEGYKVVDKDASRRAPQRQRQSGRTMDMVCPSPTPETASHHSLVVGVPQLNWVDEPELRWVDEPELRRAALSRWKKDLQAKRGLS